MSRFFFLPSMITYALFLFLLYALTHFSLSTNFFVMILVGGAGLLFRKVTIPFRETVKSDGELYLSPVYGQVRSIRRDIEAFEDKKRGHEIRLAISGVDNKGLYLPTSGEVSYLKANAGICIPRYSEPHVFYRPIDEVAHTDLILSSRNQTRSLLRFVDCKNGVRPVVWLKSGDRGRGAACFGYYPFGGTLIIYVPENSDILVHENENVIPGQTVIAAIKDVK